MRGRELKDRPYLCGCELQEGGVLRVKVLVVGKRDIVPFQTQIRWKDTKSQCL